MTTHALLNSDKLKDKIKQIKDRLCPACHSELKVNYQLSSIYIPLESNALKYIFESDILKLNNSISTFGSSSLDGFTRLLLSATCNKCGNVSFWDCTIYDYAALVSDDLNSEGYGIEWL